MTEPDKPTTLIDFPDQDDETSYMDREVAEKLDKEIRDTADAMQSADDEARERWEQLKDLVAEAKAHSLHELVEGGFKSWPAYLADAVGLNPSNIEDRKMCVAFLISEGLPQRAIAKMLNVGVATVNRTVSQLLHDGTVEESVVSTGMDGKMRPKQKTGLERERKAAPLTPELRWRKAFKTVGEGIGTLAIRIEKDSELAAVACDELDHLLELRNDLDRTIKHLRVVKKELKELGNKPSQKAIEAKK